MNLKYKRNATEEQEIANNPRHKPVLVNVHLCFYHNMRNTVLTHCVNSHIFKTIHKTSYLKLYEYFSTRFY